MKTAPIGRLPQLVDQQRLDFRIEDRVAARSSLHVVHVPRLLVPRPADGPWVECTRRRASVGRVSATPTHHVDYAMNPAALYSRLSVTDHPLRLRGGGIAHPSKPLGPAV